MKKGELKKAFKADPKSMAFYIANSLVTKFHIKTTDEKIPEIYLYQNGIYIEGKNMLKANIREQLEELCTEHHVKEILEQIKFATLIKREEFTRNYNQINLNNGIYNIKENKLISHDPEHLFLSKIPIDYNPEAKPEVTINFIKEVLDEDDLSVIQEWFGYILFRKYFIKKALIVVGPKNTGKTTLLDLISNFIGIDNVAGVSLQKMSTDKFAIAGLYGKHINIYDDLSFDDINDNGSFKIATGGGYVTGEYKFGNKFQFTNYAKLTFSCNKIPPVKDNDDDAYFSRWIVITMDKSIEKVDKFLNDKLNDPKELSGLLNWAIEGLFRLLASNNFSYNKTDNEIKNQMACSGSSIAQFAVDQLTKEKDNWISTDDMFQAYEKYCEDNDQQQKTIEKFGRDLTKYASYIIKSKGKAHQFDTQKTGWRNVTIDSKPLPESIKKF